MDTAAVAGAVRVIGCVSTRWREGELVGIGIGTADSVDAVAAGRRCARTALQDGDGDPGLALVFCGGRHPAERFLTALRGELGDTVPVVGGSAVGVMSPALLGSSGFECGAMLLPRRYAPVACCAQALAGDEAAAGRRLAERLAPAVADGGCVLVFYDSVARSEPLALNVGSRLVEGMASAFAAALGERAPVLIGAGLLSDLELTGSFVFDGSAVCRQTAVAIALPPGVAVATAIMHGCTPASGFHAITRIDGAEVFELDGRPATDVVAEALGIAPAELPTQRLSLALTLGEKHGDPFAPFDERQYVNRLVVNAAPERGSLTLFEADFRPGSRVQLMVTDADRMVASVDTRTRELLDGPDAPAPEFALYIDCAGRSSAYHGAPVEEAEYVRQHLGDRGIPWLGFYSGVEIAPLLGRSRPLDWTGVLSLFRRAGGGA